MTSAHYSNHGQIHKHHKPAVALMHITVDLKDYVMTLYSGRFELARQIQSGRWQKAKTLHTTYCWPATVRQASQTPTQTPAKVFWDTKQASALCRVCMAAHRHISAYSGINRFNQSLPKKQRPLTKCRWKNTVYELMFIWCNNNAAICDSKRIWLLF